MSSASSSPASSIQPGTIHISDASLDRLKQKLALASLPDELDSPDPWTYGAPLADIKRLAKYWETQFSWRAAEAKINALPNFRKKVSVKGFGDIDIHFVHQRSKRENAIPLLFCHGWPGSFIEVTKLLPLLNELEEQHGGPSFHIVAPSLPNFGFSQRVSQPGFALPQYAETLHNLMQDLGYASYVTQGGDWGFWITRCIGLLYPDHCLASHTNMVRSSPPTWSSNPLLKLQHEATSYTAAEKQGLERTSWFQAHGSGYRWIQETKPQTISYAFADSPVALLAWIYEKLHDWTDDYPWTDDEICTWVSIYWFSTAGPNAHARIYYEAVNNPSAHPLVPHRNRMMKWIPKVKLGLAYFPKELEVLPRTWGRALGPVVYESEHDKGGHFAAWERPEVIVDDLNKMFGKGGPCHAIVKGKSGYE